MAEYYLYIKSFHLFAVIAWMAGLFYLPRLYVYHADAKVGSELDQTFQVMERRLLRIIMNPAMIVAIILGLWMLVMMGIESYEFWMHPKLLLVLLLVTYHGYLARFRKDFVNGVNKKSSRFYRFFNEVPTVIALIIVVLAVAKPF